MRRKACGVTMAILCVFLSGCYDNTEIDSLASVAAVGVEKGDSENIKYTFAIADTSLFSPKNGNGAENSWICFYSCSDGIANAINETENKISKKIDLSHMALILFSDECDEKDVADCVEYLSSISKVRPQTLVAVSHFSPEKYFQEFTPVMEVNAEKYFYGLFKSKSSENYSITLGECLNSVKCKSTAKIPLMSKAMEGAAENEVHINDSMDFNFRK